MLVKMHESFKNQRGFTLVELLAVVAILSILAAIAVPKMTASTALAKQAAMDADTRTIESAINIYFAEKGEYPASLKVLWDNNYLNKDFTAAVNQKNYKIEYTLAADKKNYTLTATLK
ncbi:hypothetical protein SRRS_21910 [Sporomusa rhizae]|uniref:competence type IV pilus major pilin ComGC n=1 Tax=Sporomusa rhizae TaxID=357999 RepID=UPI00352B8C6D